MSKLKSGIVSGLMALCLCFTVACGEKQSAVAQGELPTAPESLPESTNVVAALAQKDYEAVVANLAKLQQSVSTDEQRIQFLAFTREVRSALVEASATDQKAADALTALGIMTSGR
jgi:hypothetical protein